MENTRLSPLAAAEGSRGRGGATEEGSGLAGLTPRQIDRARGEQRLMARVFERCHTVIESASQSSSVPAEFLGALTANESGGDPAAARFEPAVYRHLAAVARGESPAYGSITPAALARELDDVLHPKSAQFHSQFLSPAFAAGHGESLSAATDEVLRELATSWGFTQIMGYHVIGRPGFGSDVADGNSRFQIQNSRLQSQDSRLQSQDSRLQSQDSRFQSQDSRFQSQDSRFQIQDLRLQSQDSRFQSQNSTSQDQSSTHQGRDSRVWRGVRALLDPAIHFRMALELLAEFCHRFGLDPRREFAEMFHCWNTGQPYGPPRGPATYDQNYVENGLRRMEIYREMALVTGH